MANSDILVSSVNHRQEPPTSLSTTFSIYGLAAVSISYLRSILAPILGHQMEHVFKIDRRTTKHGARFRITVPEDRQRNIIQRLERQSKQTHWRIRQNYRHRRPDQPRPTAPPPPLSRQILAVNVANISNKRPAIRHIVRNTRLWAISETCITSSKFRFTVPGFDVIQHPATGPGRRGIALGIPSCFGGHEHGSAIGTMILAKVPNFTPECLWIVGSVYVGHSGATTNYSRREAFASIRQALDRVVPFDNNHPVLIFGDWNTDPQRLQRIVHSWGHARALLTSPRVDRQTAVADHFVIRTSIRAEAQGQPPAPRAPTISRHHCLEATDRIATSNYWDVLADGATDNTDTDTDIHQLTSQFLESANSVADNLSLRLSPPATRSNRRLLSGTTKRAILASNTARQAFIAAATHTNPDPVHCNTLRDEWSRLKAAATQLERVDGRKQWVKHADNLDRAVSDGQTDLVFAAARAMSGNSSRSAAVTPLYNSNGIVQYDPTSILRVMQGHYGSLAADTTGHSLNLQYWHDRQPIQVSPNTPTIRNSDILDQDFSWNQIAAALLQMSPRKAPGDDGISTAFYQAALYMPANTQEDVPPTPFARALLRKDGDPLNPGDKRGIALINVGLKLVCKVLQMRIERFVETNNLLSYKQAGFRKREECVGQVVSLVNIIQRRQNAGLNTHVLFIDIRKAFDTVPVGALLWKLQNMGFPRRTPAFLKALYTSSSARARAGSLLSDPFPVQKVPGLSRDTNPIRGLMYADDVAVFADSEQSLLAASTAVKQWPCGGRCSLVWPSVASSASLAIQHHDLTSPLDIRLHGQLVSRVESYKYLGVLIDSKLDHSAWLKQKRSALEHTISALHPVLANHQLTLVRSQRWFWSRRTKQLYRNRYWLTPQVRPKTVKQRHSFALMETLQTCGDLASLQKYVTRQLLDTSGFFKNPSFDQLRAHGTRYLVLARMDALWTARKAIHIGILVDTHPFSVDHCYEYLGVIIDDLLTLSPWLVKKKRAITAAAHSISSLLRNNFLFTRYRLAIFNGLVLGVAYYGLKLIGGNSTLARRLQALVNTGIRMILKAPLFTPIAPMLTDCGIISLDAHSILARKIPFSYPFCSSQYVPISTNGLFHNPISTNPPITNPDISRSIPNTQSIHTSITSTSTTIPSTPTIAEIRRQRSKYAFERTFQVWGKSKLACSYVQANHASSAKFLRSPALSTGQAIGASLLSLARCGGLWDYPRALKAGLLHPTATDPDQMGSPSRCILCHSHLDCKPMAHLVVDCTHPTVFFSRVDTQLLQAINDTRVQIFDCTLHTTTTTTTTTTPASPSLSTTSINSNPYTIGASAIWNSMDIHTPIDNYQHSPRPTSQSAPSSLSSPSGFSFFSFFQFSPDTRFEPPISVAHSEIPRQAQDTVEENPTGSRTTTTDTHTAAISSTPTPTHISYIGSDDILTVLLGGSLSGTNTAGNTEAYPGQQWLTGTVEEGNLLCVNQPVAHRMCDFLQISMRVYRVIALEAPQEQSITHSQA
ncbi:hypothetical protein BASA50_004481 [Batrachochytrium salamandrivorans]|uniref:Reverse transcriptase domain-containing protein n=1 Tax=Batrachochytrium salamandrivorans TaxID=1357716 RepID=A0ABQ8FIE9_9FUNG|nr:hypothetical protein BASA50_004481 [Batrachochytrium salamandrivorans]